MYLTQKFDYGPLSFDPPKLGKFDPRVGQKADKILSVN